MRVTIYLIALPVLAAVGFAQDTPPVQPKQPTETAAPAKQPGEDKKSDKTTSQSADRMQEMKTQSYSGTLVDASCAGAGTASTSTAGSTSAPGSTAASTSTSASGTKQECALSAAATQFALQMKDGQTVRFDDVGNSRVQEAMKAHKKWNDAVSANKPVRVKVNGVLSGDKMTVMSVD